MEKNEIILSAEALDGYLKDYDKKNLAELSDLYQESLACFKQKQEAPEAQSEEAWKKQVIDLSNKMGRRMKELCQNEERIHVYSFEMPHESHAESSRLIAKLRDINTGHDEFIYYTQRAYELLFNLAYGGTRATEKDYLVVKTPVTVPVQNYGVHKIPKINDKIRNTVMCVMLRGALLPSMIMSKEIQEYSLDRYVTPFALFKISRNDTKKENNMEYILNLDRSYFDLEALNDKDLVFADPMNATGGSLVTVVNYLLREGVKPRSVSFFNAIATLKGALRVVRAIDNCYVYTLWMDPALNELAYIMPGLGDAGDRINGKDASGPGQRNILQLIADYGSNIASLYRSQLQKIENTVLKLDKADI